MYIAIVLSLMEVVKIVLASEILLIQVKYLFGQCGITNSTGYSNSCAGPRNTVEATDVTESIIQRYHRSQVYE